MYLERIPEGQLIQNIENNYTNPSTITRGYWSAKSPTVGGGLNFMFNQAVTDIRNIIQVGDYDITQDANSPWTITYSANGTDPAIFECQRTGNYSLSVSWTHQSGSAIAFGAFNFIFYNITDTQIICQTESGLVQSTLVNYLSPTISTTVFLEQGKSYDFRLSDIPGTLTVLNI